jgi:protein tyrosine/serine phosphatase
MYKCFLNIIITIVWLSSCSKSAPLIDVACEENDVGNFILKWETTPNIEGKVKVYASTNPDSISETNPVAIANIKDEQLTIIADNPNYRYYYLLVFNNKYRIKTSTRSISTEDIQNFRDLGGYKSSKKRFIKWGKLYRAAELDSLEPATIKQLKELGIKTIIDLRSKEEINYSNSSTILQNEFKVINIPIPIKGFSNLLKDIKEGRIKKDSVYNFKKNIANEFVLNNTKEFKTLFQTLLKKEYYPIIICCNAGKGRTGVACAFILKAIGVNDDTITDDYMMSNDYYDIPRASQFVYKLSNDSQEAFTTLYKAQEDFLKFIRKAIDKKYNSVNDYFDKALDFSKKDRNHLQDILLEEYTE